MDSPALVWFKRDLRVRDHAPLAAALGSGSVAALFVIEDEWLASPECDPQHLAFALQCLQELRASLREMGVPLLLRRGQLPDVFTQLQKDFPFRRLLSHEETGNGWTYARDLRVGRWCREAGVAWEEFTCPRGTNWGSGLHARSLQPGKQQAKPFSRASSTRADAATGRASRAP
jgi:deoxyribodipyrimidine photo-lyase